MSQIGTDIKALINEVDNASNAIAARIDKLSAQLTGGVTAEEAAEIQAGLQGEVGKLQALGADPSNPVPTTT